MTDERRKHPRVAYPLDGKWKGTFGEAACRIGDVSAGGCFVYARALPAPGDRAMISIVVGDDELRFTAAVVHVDPGMGFSVEFRDLTTEQRAQIQELLTAVSGGPD